MTEHADVERAQDTERTVERACAEARPSAKDLIEKLMVIYGSLAATFQPGSLKSPNPNADDALFRLPALASPARCGAARPGQAFLRGRSGGG